MPRSVTKKKNPDEVLIQKLSELDEFTLTRDILMPLMRKLGWVRVDYYGGAYEKGKDIICWRLDELDLAELGVVQVKKFRPSGRASDERSFMEVVNQLLQAVEKKVPNLDDGTEYLPSTVYFITPFSIQTRALETRFEKYAELRRNKVKIIDGPLLLSLAKKHLSDTLRSLFGHSFSIDLITDKYLNNDVLLRVLNVKEAVDISYFYCDLDFSVGNEGAKYFFEDAKFPDSVQITGDKLRWNKIKDIELIAQKNGFSILTSSIHDIEQENIINNFKNQQLSITAGDLINFLSNLHQNIINLLAEKETITVDDIKDFARPIDSFISAIRETEFEKDKIIDQLIYIKNEAIYILNGSGTNTKSMDDDFINEEVEPCCGDIQCLVDSIDPNKTEFTLNGIEVNKFFKTRRDSIFKSVEAFNEKAPSKDVLKSFIVKCAETYGIFNSILHSPSLSSLVIQTKNEKTLQLPRLRIGLNKVLDTGLSLVIKGEAGAGKTTSLQMYAKYFYDLEYKDKLLMYIPLATVFSRISADEISKSLGEKNVIDSLIKYFNSEGVKISAFDFKEILSSKKEVTILFDGLDEIHKNFPWFASTIQNFSEQFPHVQCVISARSGGKEAESLPFFFISLLPFSEDQQNKFIYNWLESRKKVDLVPAVLAHLAANQEVREVVKNPLLATIFCVLAENSVPLPDTEVAIYNERLRLLLGDYDLAKGSYRISSRRETIMLVAKRLAFGLHLAQKREHDIESLKRIAFDQCRRFLQPEEIELAIEELISPCNLLTTMSNEIAYGFGHLRYQEHLAALELTQNRTIDVGEFLQNYWWRGALVMYSKMTDSISDIFDWVTENSSFSSCQTILGSMIEVRPPDEARYLMKVIEGQIQSENLVTSKYY